MPKKLRRSKARYKVRSGRRAAAVQEVGQRQQPLPLPAKETPLTRTSTMDGEGAERYRYVLSDLKRAAIIGGALLILLIVLSLLLR